MRRKIRIAVLESGHILEGQLASGDKLLEKIAIHLPPNYLFYLLIPSLGVHHWKKSGLKVNYLILPKTPFDNRVNPVFIFLSYCARSLYALLNFKKLPAVNILYSSTHILPDILPAYLFKKIHPEVFWIAKIHHLNLSPMDRPGNLLINIISSILQGLTLFCLKNAGDLILVNNSLLLRKLKELNFKKNKLTILGNGIDYTKIIHTPVMSKTPSYHGVYVGRLHATKGIFDLIPIWKEVVKTLPQAKLAIVGNGPENVKNSLIQKIRESHLEENISLLGFVKKRSLYSLMKKAQVFLFTDHEAGWGIAVAEAMACKLPVLGYDIGVLDDVFKNGFKTVRLADTKGFAQETIQLLENDDARKKLTLQAFIQSKNLDWEKTAKKFIKIIQSLSLSA